MNLDKKAMSFVCFITRSNTSVQKRKCHGPRRCGNRKQRKGQRNRNRHRFQNQTVVSNKAQEKNFDVLANLIIRRGWQKNTIYCYGYMDNNNVFHILGNDILAFQRW